MKTFLIFKQLKVVSRVLYNFVGSYTNWDDAQTWIKGNLGHIAKSYSVDSWMRDIHPRFKWDKGISGAGLYKAATGLIKFNHTANVFGGGKTILAHELGHVVTMSWMRIQDELVGSKLAQEQAANYVAKKLLTDNIKADRLAVCFNALDRITEEAGYEGIPLSDELKKTIDQQWGKHCGTKGLAQHFYNEGCKFLLTRPTGGGEPVSKEVPMVQVKPNALKSTMKVSEKELDKLHVAAAVVDYDSKFMPYYVPVTYTAVTVAPEDVQPYIVVRNAVAARADIILRERGEEPTYTTIKREDGDIKILTSPLVAAQFNRNIGFHPEMTKEEVCMNTYNLFSWLREQKLIIVTTVQDFVLCVKIQDNMFNSEWLGMAARVKAGTLRLADGNPAYTNAMAQMVETCAGVSFTDDKLLSATTDGAIWMHNDMKAELPAELLGVQNKLTTNKRISLGGRALNRDTVGTTELGKTNVVITPEFPLYFMMCTGREWVETDPKVLIPSVTMKNFLGEGVRDFSFQWLTGTWTGQSLFTKERVSIGEHMSSRYTAGTSKRISNKLMKQAEEVSKLLGDKDAVIDWLGSASDDDLDNVLSGEETGDASVMAARKSLDNVRDWVKEKMPMHRVKDELVLFFMKKICAALALRDTVLTIKGEGHPMNIPGDKHASLPTELIVPLSMVEKNVPAAVEPFITLHDDCAVLDLQGAVKANGGMCLKRTPVVNGKMLLRYEDIAWDDETMCVRFSKQMLHVLSADLDGDFFKFSFEYGTKYVDISELSHSLGKMEAQISHTMKVLAREDEDLPRHGGEPDALGEIKEIITKLDAQFPGGVGAGDILRALEVQPHIGTATNAANDAITTVRAQLLARDEEGWVFTGALGRVMTEGFIHLVKHPEGHLYMDAKALRKHFWKLFNISMGEHIMDKYKVPSMADERLMRKGAKLDRILVAADLVQYDTDLTTIATRIKDSVDQVRQDKSDGMPVATRSLTIEEQYAGMKYPELTDRAQVMPLFHAALNVLDIDISWILERDTAFDTVIAQAMPAVVEADKHTTGYQSEKAVFHSMYQDGQVNWDSNLFNGAKKAGTLAAEYFKGNTDASRAIITQLRDIRPMAAAFVLMYNLYAEGLASVQARGFKVANPIDDDFTVAELRVVRRILDLFRMGTNPDDNHTISFSKEEAVITPRNEFMLLKDAGSYKSAKNRFDGLYSICKADGLVSDLKAFKRLIGAHYDVQTGISVLVNGYTVKVS